MSRRTWMWELSNPNATDEDYENQDIADDGYYQLIGEDGAPAGQVATLDKAEQFIKTGLVQQAA